VKSGPGIFTPARFVVIVCAGLFCCSQAIGGGRFVHTSSDTSVTGGTVVRKDHSSITIKELDTNELILFLFIDKEIFFATNTHGVEHFPDTQVIVNGQTTTKDKIKVGMRAQIVFYSSGRDKFSGDNFMKSITAISAGKQKPAE
jgi:hypothetical protein